VERLDVFLGGLIMHKFTVEEIFEKILKEIIRYDYNTSSCSCCGTQVYFEEESDGTYIKYEELEELIKTLRG
jgi:hypothetical protein